MCNRRVKKAAARGRWVRAAWLLGNQAARMVARLKRGGQSPFQHCVHAFFARRHAAGLVTGWPELVAAGWVDEDY